MLNKMLEKPVRGAWLKGFLAACLLAGSGAAMAAGLLVSNACTSASGVATCNLWAKAGTATPPGGAGVTVWGYTSSDAGTVSNPGGPVLIVNQGDVVTVNLTNRLATNSGILFQGQNLVPDGVGAPPTGGTKSYTFTASSPGTFLYEAAPLLNAEHQVAMGLYGALIVRPATTTQAYGDAATAFVDEAVLVLSEIDPALNNSAAPASFDMRNFAPKFFLINGKPYPATDSITGTAGNKLLLRYVNAGAKHHSMSVLGLRQLFVAKDAGLLTSLNYNVAAETLAPGQTGDALVTVPTTAASTAKFAVYDASLSLHNSDTPGFGGMLAFVNASGTPPAAGPTVTALSLSGSNLSASIAAAAGKNVAAAQYKFDANSYVDIATGSGGVAFGSNEATIANFPVTVPTAAGTHTLYVRGKDDTSTSGTWGDPRALTFSIDTTGPTTTITSLTPNPSNGSVSVTLLASASDAASGGSNVVAAEVRVDGSLLPPTAVTLNGSPAAIRSLTAVIPSGLAVGAHPVTVRTQDAKLNWGAVASTTLNVVSGGPVTSEVSASPNPANGVQGANTSSTAVRVTAKLTATAPATVAGAEAFVDTAGANGSGFPFVPSDGSFNGQVEWGYGEIPLATVASLPAGPHTIHVHGRDAAGNWGTFITTTLVVNQSAPTVTNIVLTPAITNSAAVAISASATDVATGNQNIAGGEYFIDTLGAAASGSVMTAAGTPSPTRTLRATIASVNVAALAEGSHTVYIRGRDAAGNWSAPFATTLLIDRTPPSFNGIALAPAVANFGASVVLTANGAADPTGAGGAAASGIAGGEYWFGTTVPAPGSGTAFTGTSLSIALGNNRAPGTYTIGTRMRDRAGNWSSTVATATFTIAPVAVADVRFITANTTATQTSDLTNNQSLLNNDRPNNGTRTTALASAPGRTQGTGTGTLTLSCPSSIGTAATPAIDGNTICTNGRYRATLAGSQASKRGTFQFTYTLTVNGVISAPAAVTITVN